MRRLESNKPLPGSHPSPVVVDARGGRLEREPREVRLPGGPLVRFDFGDGPRAPAHLGLCLDRSIVRLDRLRRPPSRQVAWLVETPEERWAPRVARFRHKFRRVLTFDEDLLAHGEPFERFHYGTSWAEPRAGEKSRLVSMISSTRSKLPGHQFRLKVLDLARSKGVECFGRGHRDIAQKNEGLDPFAFSVAVENCRRDEYFTEKLIDCFLTETVPLYWGFPSLARLFDPRGVLTFSTLAEFEKLLSGLSMDLYEAMRPHVLENRRRVEALELDTPGLWRRAARVMAREAAGLTPESEPWNGRWRWLRGARAPFERRQPTGACAPRE